MKIIISDEKENYHIFNGSSARFTHTRKESVVYSADPFVMASASFKYTDELNKENIRLELIIDIYDDNILRKINELCVDGEKNKVFIDNFIFSNCASPLLVQGRIFLKRIEDGHILLGINQLNYIKSNKCAYYRTYDATIKRWNEWVKVENKETIKELPIKDTLFGE